MINLAISELGWNVYLLEVAVLLTEALAAMMVFRAKFQKALLFSFCANAFSYGTGVVLFAVGWL